LHILEIGLVQDDFRNLKIQPQICSSMKIAVKKLEYYNEGQRTYEYAKFKQL